MQDFISKGTPEQEFMLMMHDRIVELEKLVIDQKKEIDDLREQVSANTLRYNFSKNAMSDGGSLCWNLMKGAKEIIYFDSGHIKTVNNHHLTLGLTNNGTLDFKTIQCS